MSEKYAAFGTLFKRGDGAGPEVFATVGGVRSLGGPSRSKETIDVTSHDSPSRYREFVASLKDGGEITIGLIFDPADTVHVLLNDDFEDDELHNYQVVFPDDDSTTWAISGLVTAYAPTANVEDALTADLTIKISGPVTIS